MSLNAREELPAVVFLIGYRGCGKTAVGKSLAEKLRSGFEDTDLMVEETIGRTIAECFFEEGEATFRKYESEALERLYLRIHADGERLVVATGGGIILAEKNVDRMRASGRVVWLAASVETLKQRIATDGDARPALQGASSVDEVADVLAIREPLYSAAAHVRVDVDRPKIDASFSGRADGTGAEAGRPGVEEVAEEVLRVLRSGAKD